MCADGNVVFFLGLKKISLSLLFFFKTTIAMNREYNKLCFQLLI